MANLILIKSKKHAEAILRRDAFLIKHPELLPLQRKIDDSLVKARTSHNRLVVMNDLLMESVANLYEKLAGFRQLNV